MMGARPTKLTIPKPAAMPKEPFVTEAELARLVKVSPGTIRAWRRRGETPAPATGLDAEAFAESRRKSGSPPVVYRCSDVSAWIFGKAADGRPPELPASAFDPRNDRTMQLRRAGQAAKKAGDTTAEKRVRRQLTNTARLAARLGFSSPTGYEDWLARGAPEDELPPECRSDPEPPVEDDPSIEKLQLRSDAAIAKMRGVSPRVVTAERRRTESRPSLSQPAPIELRVSDRAEPPLPLPIALVSASSPWKAFIPADDDAADPPPFASNVVTQRRAGGYFNSGH
jgi:hypothetical protein